MAARAHRGRGGGYDGCAGGWLPRAGPPIPIPPTMTIDWTAFTPWVATAGRVRIWAAHGWRNQLHPKRVAEWLLIEWPEGAESPSDYWLADLGPQRVGLRRCLPSRPALCPLRPPPGVGRK